MTKSAEEWWLIMAGNVQSDGFTRSTIAFILLGAGALLIAAVAGVAIIFAGPDERADTSRLVFTTLVSVVGTWIGTILAFYFGAANVKAGSEATVSALQAAGQLAGDTPVSKEMTPVGSFNPIRRVADLAEADGLTLKSLQDDMARTGKSRVPILTKSGAALLVVHRPDIDRDQSKQIRLLAQQDAVKPEELKQTLDGRTLGQLREDSALKAAVEMFATVPLTATMAQARDQMKLQPDCKDVFVTSNGERDGAVLGWLTNSALARVS